MEEDASICAVFKIELNFQQTNLCPNYHNFIMETHENTKWKHMKTHFS